MRRKNWVRQAAFGMGVLLSGMVFLGCVHREVVPFVTLKTSETPEAWKDVSLAYVKGDSRTELDPLLALAMPPAQALEQALRARLPQASATDARVRLRVENVRAALNKAETTLGLAADFTLQTMSSSVTIRLEHSVTCVSNSQGAFSRAVYDLTDRLLYHPKALEFLESGSILLRDSALIDEPEARGPIMPLSPSAPGIQAGGRYLWGDKDTTMGFMGLAFLSGDPGFIAAVSQVELHRYYGFAMNAGLGGMFPDKGDSMFMAQVGLSAGLGFNGTWTDADGYVLAPGLSVLVGPSFNGLTMMASGVNATMIQIGGKLDFDLPVLGMLGFRGGAFVGGNFLEMSFTETVPGMPSSQSSSSFIWYPYGDLYYQTATGRISIGMTFQSLKDAKNFLENPVLLITYEMRKGRGLAYEKEQVQLADFDLVNRADTLSTPRNAFLGTIPPAPPPALDPALFGGAPASSPISAPKSGSPAPESAAPLAAPVLQKKKLVVLYLRLDPSLPAETSAILDTIVGEETAKKGLGQVPSAFAAKLIELAGEKDLDTPEKLTAAARSMEAALALTGSIRVVGEGKLVIELSLLEVESGDARTAREELSPAGLVEAFRRLLAGLLP
ncbi:MAG: hypothetical protein GYA21_14690 [Myxococcales bacterium]|nr:hypothetical protein [Myxococcales bacterium]